MKNPYEVLGISQDLPINKIAPAMAMAMAKKKGTPQEIQIAKQQLSSPERRLAADFTFLSGNDSESVNCISLPNVDETLDVENYDVNKYDSF